MITLQKHNPLKQTKQVTPCMTAGAEQRLWKLNDLPVTSEKLKGKEEPTISQHQG